MRLGAGREIVPVHPVKPRDQCTDPPWQELSELLQHWSGAVMCPACLCGGEAAGHNALRGSGPNQKHAFERVLLPEHLNILHSKLHHSQSWVKMR